MKRHKVLQAAKDGLVMVLRVIAVLAALLADGTYSLYHWAYVRLAPPVPPEVRNIPVKQLGVKTGQIVFVRKIKRVKIPVRYIDGSE